MCNLRRYVFPIWFIMYENTKLWTLCDIKKAKPLIHQFTNLKYCKKAREPFKIPFLTVYHFLFTTLKKHFKACFFILKALKDILQHSWFPPSPDFQCFLCLKVCWNILYPGGRIFRPIEKCGPAATMYVILSKWNAESAFW